MKRLKYYENILAALKNINEQFFELHKKTGLTQEEADIYYSSVLIHSRLLVMYTNKILNYDKKTI